MWRLSSLRLMALMLLFSRCKAFYIPGVNPQSFAQGDEVSLKVNSMTSYRTQIPKDFYSLPFCLPSGGPKMASQNLGEYLTGNKIQSSAYTLNMLTDVYCQQLCQVKLSNIAAVKLRLHIKYGYHNNWIVDNLPSATLGLSAATGEKQTHYAGGFPIGFVNAQSQQPYIFNHVHIILDYYQLYPPDQYRVVGFAVAPMSIKHQYQDGDYPDSEAQEGLQRPLATCSVTKPTELNTIGLSQTVAPHETILYTYDVSWRESAIAWSSRWDIYLNEDHLVPDEVHWHSIYSSVCFICFISMLILCVVVRMLHQDIAKYRENARSDDDDDVDEKGEHNKEGTKDVTKNDNDVQVDEIGWMALRGDVFRPPQKYPMFYCICIGSGVQLGVVGFFVLLLSALGFLNPSRRGSLLTAILTIYMLTGSINGYVSARLYKAFGGKNHGVCALTSALALPSYAMDVFFGLNLVLWLMHSSGSAPFSVVLQLAAMWGCINIPLVMLGAQFAFKKQEAIAFPTATSAMARTIPQVPLYRKPLFGILIAGFFPFAAGYVEFFFIMTNLWMYQHYYAFFFGLIVYLLMLVTSAQLAVLVVYSQLRAENHQWWWLSFWVPGSSGLYFFLYSIVWFRSLEAANMAVTYCLYFGYMAVISGLIMLVTGAVGSLTSLWFVRKIYGSIKSEDYRQGQLQAQTP